MGTVNRTIETDNDKAMASKLIEGRSVPFTLSLTDGKHSSTKQNKTQFMWFKEISEQKGDTTAQEVRAYCKLVIGVPILRDQNEAFRIRYDEVLKPLSYEMKLSIMGEPFNLPVTSLMSVKQMSEYMDAIFRHFSSQGIILTIPDDPSFNSGQLPPSEPDTADGPPPSVDEAGSVPPLDTASQPIEDRALLIECCAKFMALTKEDANLDAPARRGILVSAKDAWKSVSRPDLHPQIASFFLSADAIITGKQKNREGAIREFAHVLGCDPSEIGGDG